MATPPCLLILCRPYLSPPPCRVPHTPLTPQTPRPDNWGAYSCSLYKVFPLYRVGSGLVEMVVGTTRKPFFLCGSKLCDTGSTGGEVLRQHLSSSRFVSFRRKVMGLIKCKMTPARPPPRPQTSARAPLPVFGCVVASLPPSPSPCPSVCRAEDQL